MGERLSNKEIVSSWEYYSHPVVARTISQYLGRQGEGFESPPGLLDTDPKNLDKIKSDWSPEYLVVASQGIAGQKPGRAPARSIKPWDLPFLLREAGGGAEIYQSLWQKDAPGQEELPPAEKKPIRTLMLLDVEYYHRNLPGKVFSDQEGVFGLLEPVYQGLVREFKKFGISYMTVMTGKGYHLVNQVPNTSEVMNELIEIGSLIDPDVKALLAQERPYGSKRDRSVPLKVEQAHKGMGLLSQYIYLQAVREARAAAKVPVEFSDLGIEGISLDLTPNLVRNACNSGIGTCGSLYCKPYISPDKYGPDIVRGMSQMVRIVRENKGRDLGSWEELVRARQNYGKAVNNLEQASGAIPDGSEGIKRLIAEYRNSGLKRFHEALDNEPGNIPSEWEGTYRNYNGIAGDDKRLRDIITNANDKLLDPNNLNYVLNTLFERWGGNDDLKVAGHVRTWLRSTYEDPRFNWGNMFMRHYSAMQHANGWTTIILGQRFGG